MNGADLSQSINQALGAGDWGLARRLGEQAVSEGLATDAVLYNLGITYLHENVPSMAVAILLAIPKHSRDELVDNALKEALGRSGLGPSDLDIGSHGFKSVSVDLARAISPILVQPMAAFSLFLLIVAVLLAVSMSSSKKAILASRLGSLSRFFIGLFGFMVVVLLSLEWFSDAYRGQWCAVVSPNTVIRKKPVEDGEVLRDLRLASPVLAISDVKKPWVRILHSSGASGWIESLKLRCVDEPK